MRVKVYKTFDYTEDDTVEGFQLEVESEDSIVDKPEAVVETYLKLREELIKGIKKEDK